MNATRGSGSTRARRPWWKAVIAKACVPVIVLFLYAYCYPVFFSRSGIYGAKKMIWRQVTVQVHHPSSELPEVYLCVTKVEEQAQERPIVKLPLHYGEPLDSDAGSSGEWVHLFHCELDFWLMKFRRLHSPEDRDQPNQGGICQTLADLLHGNRPAPQLWHPERYRLRVVSPRQIQCEPAYFALSKLESEDPYFVVTMQ